MEVQPKWEAKAEIQTKRRLTIKHALQIYGAAGVIGMFLTIFTIPISINGEMELFINEGLKMNTKEMKELTAFIVISTLIYFGVIHIVYRKRKVQKKNSLSRKEYI